MSRLHITNSTCHCNVTDSKSDLDVMNSTSRMHCIYTYGTDQNVYQKMYIYYIHQCRHLDVTNSMSHGHCIHTYSTDQNVYQKMYICNIHQRHHLHVTNSISHMHCICTQGTIRMYIKMCMYNIYQCRHLNRNAIHFDTCVCVRS